MNAWPRYRKRIAIILLGASAFISAAISFSSFTKQQPETGAFRNFNVLLITLDTTRRDHLPMYGYSGVKTPNLDNLAANSYVFEDAISHTPLTLPAHTSILTGMLPMTHGVRDNTGFFVGQKLLTLPEILKSVGYSTSAFVSAFVLDSRWQLNQGFDLYHDFFSIEEFNQLTPQDAQRRAEETGLEATQWLRDQKDRPFFSWVHFYDPHDPYDPPEPFKSEYSSRPYDGEIAYMDASIGKLLDAVASSDLKKKTIILITADHGEGLGQHQEDTHAMFVYDTTQRVPLLIHVPGMRPNRVTTLTRHIDLAPTILDLLGIEINQQMQGSSLIPFMNGSNDKNRSAYMESLYADLHFGWSPIRSLVTSRFKYIDSPKPELYDRIQDPNETRNLINSEINHAKILKQRLREEMVRSPDRNVPAPEKMDSETEAGLHALGYIGTIRSNGPRRNIDPKDGIHLARDLQIAKAHVQNQRYDDAIRLLMALLHEDPGITDAHFLAGVSFIGLERYDQAIDQFNKTLDTRPNDVMSLYNLGYAYEQKSEEEKALKYFLQVVKQEPLHLYANSKIGRIYHRGGQTQKAHPYFLNAANGYLRFLKNAKSGTAGSALHARAGEAYFGAGNLVEAAKHFRFAVELTPQNPDLHYNLGSIYEAGGNADAAMQAYLREIELNPENYKAFNNLGLIYQRAGRLDQAEVCFQRIIDLLPNEPRGYLMLASLYREMGRDQDAGNLLRKLKNQGR